MKICYIIPSLFRDSLLTTINSIKAEDNNATIVVVGNVSPNPAAPAINRNLALKTLKGEDFDWVVFVDDDDLLSPGYMNELDSSFDLVVLRMKCGIAYIPKLSDNSLYECNVGINIAINLKTVKLLPKFDTSKNHEDWFFIQDLLDLNTIKHKVTKDVFYLAEHKGNKQ